MSQHMQAARRLSATAIAYMVMVISLLCHPSVAHSPSSTGRVRSVFRIARRPSVHPDYVSRQPPLDLIIFLLSSFKNVSLGTLVCATPVTLVCHPYEYKTQIDGVRVIVFDLMTVAFIIILFSKLLLIFITI